jgi:hypothetical protein
MIRLSLMVAFASLFLCGCGRVHGLAEEPAAADGVAAANKTPQEKAPEGKDNESVKTPLIRALLQTIDESKGESSKTKDSLRRSLLDADRQLSQVLGGKSKQLIMQANKKPPVLVIGGITPPGVKTAPGKATHPHAPQGKTNHAGKAQAAAKPSPSTPPKSSGSSAEDSRLYRALMQAIDQAEGEPQQVKDELKKLVRRTSKELDRSLEGNSQAPIGPATKEPARPAVHESTQGGVKIREFHWTEPQSP